MSLIENVGKLISKLKLPPLIKTEVKQPVIINNLNIINDDHSQTIVYNPVDKTCVVNLDKLKDDQKKDFLTSIIEGEDILLLDKVKTEFDDFRLQEKISETQEIIKFLSPKIPSEDLDIWRAALYLRSYFKKGMNATVTKLKLEIMQKYGDKGRNIANLCTAGYLEEWLVPHYDKLKQSLGNEELVNNSFLKFYKLLVNELPFTVFVCHKMTQNDLRQEINDRRTYGMDFVNIHAIGEENIAKIKIVVDEIVKENYSEDRKGHILFVRVGFKKDGITPDPH